MSSSVQLKKLFTRMSFTIPGLHPGIMYRIRVGAVNNTDLGPFSDASFSTFTSSVAPAVGLPPFVHQAELHALTMVWETPHDNGAAITSFMLRRCWDNVDHEFKRTIQKVRIDELLPGAPYTFKVKSANSEGWSDWSKESEPIMTLTKEPEIPERPTIDPTTKTAVSVVLKVKRPYDNGAKVDAYIVQKREMR